MFMHVQIIHTYKYIHIHIRAIRAFQFIEDTIMYVYVCLYYMYMYAYILYIYDGSIYYSEVNVYNLFL